MTPDRLWLEASKGERPELHWQCPKCKVTVSEVTELRGFESDKMTIRSFTLPKTWFCEECRKNTGLCVVRDVGHFDDLIDVSEEVSDD